MYPFDHVTSYPDCRRSLFAGLSRSRCPRAGSAGPQCWGRCPTALAVPLPLQLRSTAGGRRRALPVPGGGIVSVRPRTPTVVAVSSPG